MTYPSTGPVHQEATGPLRPLATGALYPGPEMTAPVAQPARWVAAAAVAAFGILAIASETAARLQPSYSDKRAALSDLASTTASDRGVMTAGFFLVGLCLLATSIGFDAAAPGRWAIGLGGFGVLLVAAFPLPTWGFQHGVAAFLAFGSLALWPVLAAAGRPTNRWLAWPCAVPVTLLSLALLVWVQSALSAGQFGGLVERALAFGELGWLAVAVIGVRTERR